ncbi:DUF423 domain-containing protein [Teredinibacter turnerae]|uniref:DUF423 domain-containing protein n=1 Tax=Teredinibacter turnerae TaxID=2426 RepID=UPI0030D36BF4
MIRESRSYLRLFYFVEKVMLDGGRIFLAIGAGFGALAVVLGAFGAHALKSILAEHPMSIWQTAVQYQFYHALALVAVGVLISQGFALKVLYASGWLFAIGVVLFSGSLYGLALGGPRLLGPVTPLGGIAFIAAWICLLFAVVKP